jgi:hypothetical protein
MKHKLLLAMTAALVMGSAGVAQDVPHDTAKVAKETGHATTTAAKDTGRAADVAGKKTVKATAHTGKKAVHVVKKGATEDWSRGHKERGKDRRRSQVDTPSDTSRSLRARVL